MAKPRAAPFKLLSRACIEAAAWFNDPILFYVSWMAVVAVLAVLLVFVTDGRTVKYQKPQKQNLLDVLLQKHSLGANKRLLRQPAILTVFSAARSENRLGRLRQAIESVCLLPALGVCGLVTASLIACLWADDEKINITMAGMVDGILVPGTIATCAWVREWILAPLMASAKAYIRDKTFMACFILGLVLCTVFLMWLCVPDYDLDGTDDGAACKRDGRGVATREGGGGGIATAPTNHSPQRQVVRPRLSVSSDIKHA